MIRSGRYSQFWACARTLFEIPLDFNFIKFENESPQILSDWTAGFRADVGEARAGYSKARIRSSPELEDAIIELLKPFGFRQKTAQPTICLSHDIDYLHPTWQLSLKRTIGYRKWGYLRRPRGFLDSIRRILEIDNAFGGIGCATVFIAAPMKSPSVTTRFAQLVLDPSYKLSSPEFAELKGILDEVGAEPGIHGSYYSLRDDTLSLEISALESAIGQRVKAGRQHWLNLTGKDPFTRMLTAGIEVDSTLGWNGSPGFRGGMARAFPIVTGEGKEVWEVPLVLMDGPLFDDLRLDTEAAVQKSISILEEVRRRGGCVALDWHDRSADRAYGWADAYERILKWAKSSGFAFKSISGCVAESKTGW